ncbi:MAG: hypothetical protein ACO3PR_03215 [Limisphaerales bacterium]|jgi:hypothetical protein
MGSDSSPEQIREEGLSHALVGLLRGLSSVFWGLPLILLTEAQSDFYNKGRWIALLAPWVANGLVLNGLLHLQGFHQQERIWRRALERTLLLGIIHVGLTPFLFFWQDYPREPFFAMSVRLLFFCGMLYLYQLNHLIRRLACMIPDETLRQDTELFAGLNRRILSLLMTLVLVYWLVGYLASLPGSLFLLIRMIDHLLPIVVIMLVVMPVAMTMTMVWKLKESVLNMIRLKASGSSD